MVTFPPGAFIVIRCAEIVAPDNAIHPRAGSYSANCTETFARCTEGGLTIAYVGEPANVTSLLAVIAKYRNVVRIPKPEGNGDTPSGSDNEGVTLSVPPFESLEGIVMLSP